MNMTKATHDRASTRTHSKIDIGVRNGTPVGPEILKRLIAPSNLNWAEFAKLAAGVYVEELPPGTVLFREGSRDNNIVYLLEGDVKLSTFAFGRQGAIRGGSLESRCPIAEEQPRNFTGTAMSPVTIIQFERSKADSLGTMHDHSQIEVSEIRDGRKPGTRVCTVKSGTRDVPTLLIEPL